MAIGVALIVLLVALCLAFLLSVGKSRKIKYIIWGITTMGVIAPLFTWLISMLYADIEGSGWTAVALMMVFFPIIFFTGLVSFLAGVIYKNSSEQFRE